MKRPTLARVIVLICALGLCLSVDAKRNKAPKESQMGAYLMVYHKDATHSLHAAISYDGYRFTALNDDEPIIGGDTIALQGGIRDPHIYRGPDGAFYIAMTDLHIYASKLGLRQGEWERDGGKFGWGNNRALVLMKSYDLINWTHTSVRIDQLDPSLADIGCAWAPETVYDSERGQLMIHFTMRHGKGLNKLYYCYVNDAFDTILTKPEVLFTYPKEGKEAIDGDIVEHDGIYHLFYCSHDGTAGVKQATSLSIRGPWLFDNADCDPEPRGCEAPHVYKLIGQQKWILMYDIYRINPHNFGFSETTDLKTFTDIGHFDKGKMTRTNFSEQKHGAVVWLTKKEAKRLEKYWKANARKYSKRIDL